MNKILFGLLLLLVAVNNAMADFNNSFQNGLNVASSHQNQAQNSLNQFDPKSTFNNYTSIPDQSKYYSGVTQSSTAITNDSINVAKTDNSAKAIQNSFDNRPKFTIDTNSPDMKKSLLIQNNSSDIVKGISDQFIDCTKKQDCSTTYKTQTCEETPAELNQYCKKILNITMIPHQVVTHYHLGTRLSVSDHNYAGINTNVVTGQNIFVGPHDATFWLDGRLPGNIDCHTLQGKIVSTVGNAHLDNVYFPTCGNGLQLSYHISSGHRLDLNIDMTTTTTTYEPNDQWDDGCGALANNSSCTFQSETCVQPQSTHTIQGIPVTRDCWEKEDSYLCRMGAGSNTCQPYKDQGCEQIGSVCENKSDGGCMLYQQTFRCPVKQCTDVGVVCNGQTYCITDDCVKHDKQADPDFQKAVSALSVMNEAAKQFDQQFIFQGSSKSCSEAPIGYLNCCVDDGWGQDVHLASCSDEEKSLGKDKANGLSIYVGEYCKNDVMGICTSNRKSYCVFPSKLARIIQDQGRNKQLHIGFGDKEHPDCRGITPEELQEIDFSKIDFSDFYSDIAQKEHVEDPAQVNQKMEDRIQQLVQGGKPH